MKTRNSIYEEKKNRESVKRGCILFDEKKNNNNNYYYYNIIHALE